METSGRPQDWYAVLGVPSHATQKEIERAILRWRADRLTGAVCAESLWRAEQAYHTLAEPALRRRHDRQTGRSLHPAWSPGRSEAARRLLRLGILRLALGRGDALAPLLRAVHVTPDCPACRSYLGLALARAGGNLCEALRQAASAVVECRGQPVYLWNLAAVCDAAGLRPKGRSLRLRGWLLALAALVAPSARPRKIPPPARLRSL